MPKQLNITLVQRNSCHRNAKAVSRSLSANGPVHASCFVSRNRILKARSRSPSNCVAQESKQVTSVLGRIAAAASAAVHQYRLTHGMHARSRTQAFCTVIVLSARLGWTSGHVRGSTLVSTGNAAHEVINSELLSQSLHRPAPVSRLVHVSSCRVEPRRVPGLGK